MATQGGGRDAKFDVSSLRRFRAQLAAMGDQFPDELRLINRIAADEAAEMARRKAESMGSVFAKAAPQIRAYATQSKASVGFPINKGIASAAFFGTIKRTGWYNRRRYLGNSQEGASTRSAWIAGAHSIKQHPPWMGQSWEVGVAGEGPYAINDALAEGGTQLEELYGNLLDQLAKKSGAFPD